MEKSRQENDLEKVRLFLGSPDEYSVCTTDTDGVIRSCNPNIDKIQRFSAEQLKGRDLSVFFTDEEVLLNKQKEILDVALTDGLYADEGWRIMKDGKRSWVSFVITPLFDEHDNHDGFSLVFRNLTSRKKKAEALIKSEERYRWLVNGVRDYAIYMLDPDGYILSWNEGGERLKGYKKNEVIGKHFSIFYVREDVKDGVPVRVLQTARAKGSFEGEGWRVRKDGRKFWANLVVTAIYDDYGELVGFSKVTRDLTERREAEERFRLLVEGVKDYAIFMLDTNGNILTWNVGAERLKGYKAHEVLGRHFSMFYQESDRLEGKPELEMQEALRLGHIEDEGWRIRKDGTAFWANVIMTAVYNDDGKHLGFSKVTRDLTDRKRAEIELKKALENKDQFIGIASHELKTPLTSAKAFVQLASRELSPESKKTVGTYLEKVEEHMNRLSRLIHDLLDVSKIQAGKLVYTMNETDLVETVRKAVETMTPHARKHEIVFENHSDKPLIVIGDSERLEQVFTNVLINSIKYSPKADKVIVSICRKNSSAIVSIKDFGIGIAKEHHGKIFQRFYRSEGLSPYFAGLGLGLFISSQILERHSGKIWVESVEGEGATFFICLPLKMEVN